jgi:hypothetical protein
MKITIETEFQTREQLDAFVLSRFGGDQEKNNAHEIEVTDAEAQKLGLSDKVKVHGVRVIKK